MYPLHFFAWRGLRFQTSALPLQPFGAGTGAAARGQVVDSEARKRATTVYLVGRSGLRW